MPFSIAEIVNDPDFAQTFTIVRSQGGQWILGRWQESKVSIQAWGAIQPPEPEELEQIPEGDRMLGVVAIWVTQRIYKTNVNDTGALSDQVIWLGENYRVYLVYPWDDYGYQKALAVRMSGQ